MSFTPTFQAILDEIAENGNRPLPELQKLFQERVGALSAKERMNNLYRIRPKRSKPGETSRFAWFRMNKMQSDYWEKQTNRDLILKMRQGGVTTLSCLKALDMAIWNKGTNTAIMAHVRESVKGFFDIVKDSFAQFQKDWGHLYPLTTRRDNRTELAITETGSNLKVCTETKGLTLDFLHISEACFVEDSRISESIESVPYSGQVVMESTPNIAAGMFYDMWVMGISGKECPYTNHFYPWWWHYPEEEDWDFFAPKDKLFFSEKEKLLVNVNNLKDQNIVWRRMKIAEAGGNEGEFERKYPEDPETCFLSGSSSVFDPEILNALYKNQRPPSFVGDLVMA